MIRERQAAKQRARSAEAQLAQLRQRLAQLDGGTGFQPASIDGGTGFQPVSYDEIDGADADAGLSNLAPEPPALDGEDPAAIDGEEAADAAGQVEPLDLGEEAREGADLQTASGRAVAAHVAADAATAPNSSSAAGGTPSDSSSAPQSGASPTPPPAAADSPTPPAADARTLRRRLAARERQLAALLRDQRLRAAALAAGAVNPDQVVALLRQQVRMVEGADGQFAPCFLDGRGRVAADEAGKLLDADGFVRTYLSRPENANLVRAGSVGGSGARLAGSAAAADGVPTTLADFNALDPRERRRVALKLSRRQREALLGLRPNEGAGYL